MKHVKLTKNPFLLFAPFLLFYLILVFVCPTSGTTGDENRYLMFSEHLLHGFYSYPAPNIDIGDGPGYPILILPFLAFKLPLICIALLNAILYYLSIILLFKSLQQIVSYRITIVCCLFWGCFFNSYKNLSLILPETFTAFLMSLLLFNVLAAFDVKNPSRSKRYIIFSGITIGFIVLTKIIFGYVLMWMLGVSGIIWILNRTNVDYKKMVAICLIALITTIPYLIYTFHITNNLFYWGTTGGENFYWMSSPYKGEYGSWVQYPFDPKTKNYNLPGAENLIEANHKNDFKEIFKYRGPEKDSVYTRLAIQNIKSHPIKFLKNCISNIGRMLFNFPYSYTLQKNTTLFIIALNGIVVVCSLFCFIPTFINWRKILFPIRFLLFFIFLYFSGSILASAETRMFTVMVPILIFWIAFIIQKTIKINLNNW